MSETVIVALISTGGSVAIGITALILNFRMFTSLERRIERLEAKFDALVEKINDLDKRLTLLERGRGLVHSEN